VPRKTAENTVKHLGGSVGSVVAEQSTYVRFTVGGEILMVVTTLVTSSVKTNKLVKQDLFLTKPC